jgi:hypothetical protein
MSHPSLEELTQAVHGLAPTPDHLGLCAECQETVERLRGERDLLRRADARLAVPLPERRHGALFLLALAAAALLAITGVVVLRRDPPPTATPAAETQEKPDLEKLVAQFRDGTDKESARARELLVDSAGSALPVLVESRISHPATLRPDAFSALLLELKQKVAGPAAAPIFSRLKEARLTIDMKNVPLTEVLAYMADVSGLNLHADPDLEASKIAVTLKVGDTPLTQLFDLLSMLYTLEYDVRFGVVFVGKPHRLFDLPSHRNSPKRSTIPNPSHWRKQELSKGGEAILKKLDQLKVDLSFNNTPLPDVIAFVRDFSEVNLILQGDYSAENVTITVKDRTAASVLELLLLPRGLDLRIEGNAVLIYQRY